MSSTGNFKKFKGNCKHCGKIGHKKAECQVFLNEEKSSPTSKTDKSDVTCYNCQEKGHYANKCTKPKVERKTEQSTTEMTMYFGMSCFELENSDAPEDQVTSSFFDNWTIGDVFDNDDDLMDLVLYFNPDESVEEYCLEELKTEVTSDLETPMPPTAEYVGLTATKENSERWFLISGAMCGVTYSKLGMTNLKPTDRKITIRNGDQVQALGQGTVTLNDSQGKSVTLKPPKTP